MENNKLTAILILLGLMLAAFLLGWLISKLINKGGSGNSESLASQITEREAELEACRKNNDLLKLKATAIASAGANSLAASVPKTEIAPATAPFHEIALDETPVVNLLSADNSGRKDDLKIVEGIGPKIEELFHNADILTFSQLASSSVEKLKEILEAAGPRYQMHDPSTWPKQAELASTGQWTALKTLQDELNAGKVN
jgi:predicted flap endonuclease-1-like 5' DNA nuclease